MDFNMCGTIPTLVIRVTPYSEEFIHLPVSTQNILSYLAVVAQALHPPSSLPLHPTQEHSSLAMFFSTPCVISGLLLLSLPAAADEVPNLPYDPATWPGCTFWYDNYGDMTCVETAAYYYIKLADMIKWNPRLSSDGTNCVGWTNYMS